MSYTPFEWTENLIIGSVDFVSPDEIRVLLDIEAPDSLSLNTGNPHPFPRVNSYVLIPIDEGYLVGQIEWITIERAAFPKRQGMKDFGLVDLPFPLRKISVNPLGILYKKENNIYNFKRGSNSLPTVGTPVLLPTEKHIKAIVEGNKARGIKIGTSPFGGNIDIYVDPNKLFGRHLAVLGNTGSGKSCSVAGLIHWSLEAIQVVQKENDDKDKENKNNKKEKTVPNIRFIILDPNGEYFNAFCNEETTYEREIPYKVRVFMVNGGEGLDINSCIKPLKVPLWFWNSEEWASFTQASPKMQMPLLRRALREVKAGNSSYGAQNSKDEGKKWLRKYLSSKLISIKSDTKQDVITNFPTKFAKKLKNLSDDLIYKRKDVEEYKELLENLSEIILSIIEKKKQQNGNHYDPFPLQDVEQIVNEIEKILNNLGGIIYHEGPDEDIPVPFSGLLLADYLEITSKDENAEQYIDPLITRIHMLLSNQRIKSIADDSDNVIDLIEWLKEYIIENNIVIVDLSLVPSELIYITAAVIARMIFEALQRYVKKKGVSLPTVLVMEEAHTFIKRYNNDENYNAAKVCTQVFERIAREGRKFGLSLVISSQRPSELSPTVLSQCNTFLLHRITNDRDQEMISKLVPDNLRGLLRELPILPTQMAILLGWATELPVLIRMRDLPEKQRPRSKDPDFWNTWIKKNEKDNKIEDIRAIVEEWQEGWVKKENNEDLEDNVEDMLDKDFLSEEVALAEGDYHEISDDKVVNNELEIDDFKDIDFS
ncbi:protein of unknown function DUF87 [Thermoanaerobacter mathranii subsp. mathranii str. A3]|uniref:Helicase HerA central domain-containing protein n=1 Tax=Thermoanaerobacter mathranii subsp. mathranii (strain DSM 11426 / CCUG 53645 / CIP 108742 / A3) TaxID=583358 RepID=A0ABM5LP52_THEM3|nr:DUF87 domain-containing protein [Thermoanaerobacter mathranii]ADH60472.1 protein of unknown function DUF87 [Thermoanaerobacter mathranii subsp. mathranii str. A3]